MQISQNSTLKYISDLEHEYICNPVQKQEENGIQKIVHNSLFEQCFMPNELKFINDIKFIFRFFDRKCGLLPNKMMTKLSPEALVTNRISEMNQN